MIIPVDSLYTLYIEATETRKNLEGREEKAGTGMKHLIAQNTYEDVMLYW